PAEELNDIHLSAVQEAMNQMMGSAATSMSTVFNKRVDISPPAIKLIKADDAKKAEPITNEEDIVKVSFQLKLGVIIDSNIMKLKPITFANELVTELLHEPDKEAEQEMAAAVEQIENMKKEKKPSIAKPAENKEQTPQYIGNPFDQNKATIQQ